MANATSQVTKVLCCGGDYSVVSQLTVFFLVSCVLFERSLGLFSGLDNCARLFCFNISLQKFQSFLLIMV